MRAATHPWLVAIAASAGGIAPLRAILRALPDDFPAAVVLVLHRPPAGESHLADVLQRVTSLPVIVPQDGSAIRPGVVYVARPDAHLTIEPHERFRYTDGTRIRFVRSSANPLMETAARYYDGHVIAIVLSGTGSDGADGVQAVKAHGGVVIAQDLTSAEHSGMPTAAVESGAVDFVLPINAIAPAIDALVHGRMVGT